LEKPAFLAWAKSLGPSLPSKAQRLGATVLTEAEAMALAGGQMPQFPMTKPELAFGVPCTV